ncbi:hypothetical protein F3Y22_tig00110114pilonHSYRG00084 [Hibiscus syriacus]|uniref:Protein FAR1-RELATED SEQUENCE n=1 Tax=Hibiscus syriacus TaxID=106335 RepID=A0A6A3BIS7_HIBSY|nr:hypothetical protein F3Y22_tig00110114pilonHSYRG00084 [Hibiscus syriacus]
MDNTDVDNVKPTEECHEVHNVDESDRLVGQLFCSRDQAWHFYKGFAREHGFSARKGTTRLEVEGNVKTQEFCCSKEGAVSKADIDEATTLKEVGVGTSQVMNYLTQQAGGYHNVGFTHKDLYNALQRGKAKEIVDGDVNALIAYFDYKNMMIPGQCRGLSNLLSLMLSTDYVLGIFLAMHKLTLVTHSLQQHSQNAWLPGGQPRNLIFNGVRLFQNSTSKSIHGCESMNASLAIALKHNKTYLDVVRAIEDGISRMRMNELKADYLSSHTKPFQITKLVDLESHAAAIFTRESFRVFQDELIRETLWTNDAKASAPSYVDLNVSPEVMQMARFAALRSTSSRLCYIASKTGESFKTARDEMKKLIEELENSFGLNHSVNQSIVVNNVRDPQRKQRKRKEVPKNKVEKKIRRCGYCNGEGHNKLTCPEVKLSLSTSTQPTSTDFFEDGME